MTHSSLESEHSFHAMFVEKHGQGTCSASMLCGDSQGRSEVTDAARVDADRNTLDSPNIGFELFFDHCIFRLVSTLVIFCKLHIQLHDPVQE